MFKYGRAIYLCMRPYYAVSLVRYTAAAGVLARGVGLGRMSRTAHP
jgi:hypothetical protein